MTTTETTKPGGSVSGFTKLNKVGFGLALLLGLTDLPSFLGGPSEGETGPPLAVLILSSICGFVTLVAIIIGWRQGNWSAIRVAAGSRIVSALLAMPAFFVEDLPGVVRILAGVFVLLTVVTVVLMLAPGRHEDGAR